jgi:general secretion pathway protein M
MSGGSPIQRLALRSQTLSVPIYCAVVGTLCLTMMLSITQLLERYDGYRSSLERLERLEQRPRPSLDSGGNAGLSPPGSPFLEGPTVTVASAALLQRVSSAITAAGGSVVSSEVEQGGAPSKDGYLKIIATCEIQQESLQRLLHDLEAGMPFLFLDQVIVQAPAASEENGRLSVRLSVSGLWPGGR